MNTIFKGCLWTLMFLVVSCNSQEKPTKPIAKFIDYEAIRNPETQQVELNWILVPDTFFVEVYVSTSERAFDQGVFLQKNKLGAAVIDAEYADQYFHLVVPGQDSVVLKIE
jgi:hypothetical protein